MAAEGMLSSAFIAANRCRFARLARSTLAATAVRPPAELALLSSTEPVAKHSGHMRSSWGGHGATALGVAPRTVQSAAFLHIGTTKGGRMRKIAAVSVIFTSRS